MSALINGANYIAGLPSREGQQTFTSVDPRTRTPDSVPFVNATEAEIDRAARAAQEAFAITRRYPAARLAALLDRLADEVEALGDDLLHTADRETGLGIPRLTGERARTTSQLRRFSELLQEGSYVEAILDTALPDRKPAPRPDIRRMLIPIGPVAVFSASNFPFAFSVLGGDTASAMAAGCPVVLKAHPGHPATSELFARAAGRAISALQFPPGFFSLLQGDQAAVGQALVAHPAIAAVGFTGSLRAGRAIFDTAARRPVPIPVYAEMGSVNPLVVLPGALAERGESIAAGLVESVTLGSGQYCTSPGLVFVVDSPRTAAFIERFTALMTEKSPGVLLNAQIESGLSRAVAHTAEKAAVQTLAGAAPGEYAGFCYPHTVMQTTADAFRADPELQHEHFGPVTLFVVCASLGDMLEALAATGGNLTGSVHGAANEADSAGQVFDVLRERVGRLVWNGFPTGVEVVYAMQHGGPYPATTAPASTSVGMTAIKRFMRPVAYQNLPEDLLPDALKSDNPLGIWRIVNGKYTNAAM